MASFYISVFRGGIRLIITILSLERIVRRSEFERRIYVASIKSFHCCKQNMNEDNAFIYYILHGCRVVKHIMKMMMISFVPKVHLNATQHTQPTNF